MRIREFPSWREFLTLLRYSPFSSLPKILCVCSSLLRRIASFLNFCTCSCLIVKVKFIQSEWAFFFSLSYISRNDIIIIGTIDLLIFLLIIFVYSLSTIKANLSCLLGWTNTAMRVRANYVLAESKHIGVVSYLYNCVYVYGIDHFAWLHSLREEKYKLYRKSFNQVRTVFNWWYVNTEYV